LVEGIKAAGKKKLTGTTTNKGEEERSIARDLGRDLKFEESGCKAEDDYVDADDDAFAGLERVG
jgi:hypothetical protein